MTTERVIRAPLPSGHREKIDLLRKQAEDARIRRDTGALGDREETVRAEQIYSELEAMAYELLGGGAEARPADAALDIVWPFAPGPAPQVEQVDAARPVAKIWRTRLRNPSPTAVTRERFSQQLQLWADHVPGIDEPAPLCPSDIQNKALTESLRSFAGALPSMTPTPIDAQVTYRDGSSGRPFPLRAVRMTREVPKRRSELHLTLLSIRHVEMDERVDGAWFRNREISLPRPAGLTDEICYEQSREQLRLVSQEQSVLIYLYQTGLPPANVGFYRALIDHHLERDHHNVAVVPRYYAGPNNYPMSTNPWVIDD